MKQIGGTVSLTESSICMKDSGMTSVGFAHTMNLMTNPTPFKGPMFKPWSDNSSRCIQGMYQQYNHNHSHILFLDPDPDLDMDLLELTSIIIIMCLCLLQCPWLWVIRYNPSLRNLQQGP